MTLDTDHEPIFDEIGNETIANINAANTKTHFIGKYKNGVLTIAPNNTQNLSTNHVTAFFSGEKDLLSAAAIDITTKTNDGSITNTYSNAHYDDGKASGIWVTKMITSKDFTVTSTQSIAANSFDTKGKPTKILVQEYTPHMQDAILKQDDEGFEDAAAEIMAFDVSKNPLIIAKAKKLVH
ncbi:MAG: hypothetical protein GY804_13370 [Alphaproteobacteria bacterium]|nr:hypothetical protein [Alphaproteobacteria bacterium]